MSWFSHDGLAHVVNNYGDVAVALAIGIESMGVPLPGETILVLAAMYAAGTYGSQHLLRRGRRCERRHRRSQHRLLAWPLLAVPFEELNPVIDVRRHSRVLV